MLILKYFFTLKCTDNHHNNIGKKKKSKKQTSYNPTSDFMNQTP